MPLLFEAAEAPPSNKEEVISSAHIISIQVNRRRSSCLDKLFIGFNDGKDGFPGFVRVRERLFVDKPASLSGRRKVGWSLDFVFLQTTLLSYALPTTKAVVLWSKFGFALCP